MNPTFNNTFGPMHRSNCDYFLIISMVGVFVMILSLFYAIIRYKENKNLLIVALSILQPFILYFQNRLLYNMCVKSI